LTDTPNDEFEAAFREATGETAEPDTAPQDAGQPNSEAAPAEAGTEPGADDKPPLNPETANQPDIWADATPEQKAAYEAAIEQARDLEHKRRSDDGRLARYQRDRDTAQRKLETLVTAAQKDGEDLKALVVSEEWKRAKADYGDDLGPVFNALERLTDQQAGVSERFQQMDAETIEEIEAANFHTLDERAPDWRDLLSRGDFSTWLEAQPKPWQEAFAQNKERLVDPTSALELVSRFRVHVALAEHQPTKEPEFQLDSKRARQLDGARSATSRTPVVADPGGGDFDAEFSRAAAAIERRRATR
jgi:hypothetical protein